MYVYIIGFIIWRQVTSGIWPNPSYHMQVHVFCCTSFCCCFVNSFIAIYMHMSWRLCWHSYWLHSACRRHYCSSAAYFSSTAYTHTHTYDLYYLFIGISSRHRNVSNEIPVIVLLKTLSSGLCCLHHNCITYRWDHTCHLH